MRGVVFTGGEGPPPEVCRAIVREAGPGALVVAADSGLILAERSGVVPDWIIGDMDSLDSPERLDAWPPERVVVHPREKDFTDTELALALLREKGCGRVRLAGGGGGRLDHLLALVALFEKPWYPERWYTARELAERLDAGAARFFAAREGPVSVFPLGRGPWRLESGGLRWPLDGLDWAGGAYSLSNELSGEGREAGGFSLHATAGSFLVLRPLPVL